MALFKSVFVISFFISISRILGFIRDIFIAKFLGVSILSDVFFAAFRLPNFFRRIFAEGAFNASFVPLFVEKLHASDGNKKALIFVRNILSFLLFSLLILIILLQIFMPLAMTIMFPGFTSNPEKFAMVVSLSRITIFYLLFISLVSLLSGILNSIGKFAATSSTSIILNSVLIFSLYLLAPHTPNLAYALSWGVFCAGVLQLLWVMFFLWKAKIFIYPTMPKITQDTKIFFRKLIPGVIGANVMQINLLVDTVIMSLIPGAVSALYYADHINQLPLAMIGIAIGTALLPSLSRKIKSGDIMEAIKLQNTALEASLILSIPATLALTCLSYSIIATLFQRGAFTATDTILVSAALKFYSIGLPAYIAVKVLEPSFFSRGDTKTPMKIAIICLVCNVIFNLIFFKPFGYIGVVLASVISSYLNLTLLLTKLLKKEYFFFEKHFLKTISKIFFCAVIMAIIILTLDNYLPKIIILTPLILLIIVIAIGLISYFGACYFAGVLNIVTKNLKPKNNL